MDDLYGKIFVSLISGMAGCLLTLLVGGVVWLVRRRYELHLLENGLGSECLSLLTMMESVKQTYADVYRHNEWRADDSLLLRVKDLLMTKYDDGKFLTAVSLAVACLGELNRLLELYRNECFESSRTPIMEPPLYIREMHCAVLASFDKASSALLGLAEYATPRLVAKCKGDTGLCGLL